MASGNSTTFAGLMGGAQGGTVTVAPTSGGANTTNSAGTGGTFPQDPNLTPTQFIESLGISSTLAGQYVDNKTGQLNARGQALVSYMMASPGERLAVQQQLVQLGYMPASDATGNESTSAATSAFEKAMAAADAAGQLQPLSTVDFEQTLNQHQVSPAVTQVLTSATGGTAGQQLSGVEQKISSNLSAANKEITSGKPSTADVTNPTTLRQSIETAFNQVLGYAPSDDQVNAFVQQIQSQDVNYDLAGYNASKQSAQDEVTRATSEESALNKLGPDGLDAFINAYAKAVGTSGVTGAGTAQGPVTATQPKPNSGLPKAGAPLPEGSVVTYSKEHGADAVTLMPQWSTQHETVPNQSPGNTDEQGWGIKSTGTHEVSTTTTRVRAGQATVPAYPSWFNQGTPLHGGTFALSPAEWKQAQDAWPAAKKYKTAGEAPATIQVAAFGALAQHLYDQLGSWSDVAIKLAGGTPGFGTNKTTEAIPGGHETIHNFAEQLAAKVNNQIEQLQNQVNAAPPSVTIKTTQPDYNAEAQQAAKNADPVGYTAANMASWGDVLNQMVFGSPVMYEQPTSDTFTGPAGGMAAATTASAGATA